MEDRSMPDTRGLLFIVNERQRRWWLDADEDRRANDARSDAAPLPTEPQRERSTQGERLALRLRLIIRPTGG
jgi:hypothetical protein